MAEVWGRAEDPDGIHMARSCNHPVGLVQYTRHDICYYSFLYSVELPVAYNNNNNTTFYLYSAFTALKDALHLKAKKRSTYM